MTPTSIWTSFSQAAIRGTFALACALLIFAASAAAQATITVNTTAQSPGAAGDCTLGEAIQAANTNSAVDACAAGQSGGSDTIILPAGTYTLSMVDNNNGQFGAPLGLPAVTSSIAIQGAGAATTIIERSSAAGTPQFTLTYMNPGPLTLSGVTIQNFEGPANTEGGAIVYFSSTLTLSNCIIRNNVTPANSRGGAITNTGFGGTLVVNNCAFSSNTAGSGVAGGAIRANGGVTITNSTFVNNSAGGFGGAVLVNGGTVNISNTLFDSNVADFSGGALFEGGGGAFGATTMTITNSVFLNNRNAVQNCGGGAIGLGSNCGGGPSGTHTITSSTFVGNNAIGNGGAIFAGKDLTVRNSTFSGNSATAGGGALAVMAATTVLNNVTIANNLADSDNNGSGAGGGLFHFNGTVTLSNTILAGNAVSGAPDCSGTLTSVGFNLVGNNSGCTFTSTTGDQAGTGAAPIDPLLSALAINGSAVTAGSNTGGFTPVVVQTRALITGSPALNAANPAMPGSGGGATETTDQRGQTRPGGAAPDIGAFEDATGTGVPATFDLSVTNADSPDPVTVGNNLTYTVTISNAGPDGAPAVVLSDPLPAGVNFVSAVPSNAPTGSCMHVAGTVTCNLGTIPAGGSVTVTILVTPTAGGTLSNTASASGTGTDSNPGNNSGSATTTVTTLTMDLSVTKTDAPDPINLGQGNVTYTVTVSNGGPGGASNVIATDTLPAAVNFVSATSSQGGCPAPAMGVLTCNLGAIANGSSATITIVVTPTASGTLTNNVSVTATETDSNSANNSAVATTTVNPAADLSITKTDSPDPVNVGTNLTYTVTVSNSGPSTATNVTLTDNLPANTTFVSAMASQGACPAPVSGVLTCNLGAINNGAMATVTIVVTPQAAVAGMITNTASVTAAEFDPTLPNNASATTTVNPVADLSVTKTDSPDPVTQGSNITYTITINNAGPSAATGVMATDAVPANVTFVSAMGSQGTCALAAGTITCNVGTINSGASATATVVVTANAAGTVTNTINVSSAVTDPNNANNSATATTTVNPPTTASDFLITAAPALQTVSPGQTATFVVTLTPIGGSFNSAITLSGIINPPLGPLSFSPTSVTPGSAAATSTLTVMVPSRGAAPGLPGSASPAAPWLPVVALALTAAALAWSRIRHTDARLKPSYAVSMALVIVLLMLAGAQTACTPAGSGLKGAYTVTVTATSGSLSHATNVTVNVQ